jgi:hypothetical protein
MVDLGIQTKNSGFDDEHYAVTYLSDLSVGDEITGNVSISPLKEREFRGNLVNQFYLIVSDHENERKWVCSINTSVYDNDGILSIYGTQDPDPGRVYIIIDSLNHILNGTPEGEKESYSVVFDTFRNTINNEVSKIKFKAEQPKNPNAKSVNIRAIEKVNEAW